MDASRSAKATLTACIQAQPNEGGIDYARIVLTEGTLTRLRNLFVVSVKHQISYLAIDDLPVQWLKNGVVVNTEPTNCDINQSGIFLKNNASASSEVNTNHRQFEITAFWLWEGIYELETDFLHTRCFNKYGQLEFEDIGRTHLEQINNIAIFDAILARDRIAEACTRV